jgi:hypothetical protein
MEEELPSRSKTLLRKHSRQLAKTEMCKFFLSNRCGKGLRCTYAHSITEIRSKPDLVKTSMCRHFLQTGNCDRPGCTFAHDERELRTTKEFFKTKLCRFSASGRCKHGTTCRFAHNIDELPPAYRAAAQAELDAAERACYESPGDSGHPSSTSSNESATSRDAARPGMQSPGEQGSGVGGTSDWGDMMYGSDYNAASSDQSTRADTSASVTTPEGSADGEACNSPSRDNQRSRGGSGNENSAQRRTERQRSGAGPTRHCTTMMLTTVPQFLTQGALVSFLEDLTVCIRGAFDFFYCPWDYTKDRNLGYAIINFFSSSVAAEFEREWTNAPQLPRSMFRRFGIVPAALQGRAANLRHFSGFSLAHHSDPRFRPLVRAAPNEALRPMAISEDLIAQSQREREMQQQSQQQNHPRQSQRRDQQHQARGGQADGGRQPAQAATPAHGAAPTQGATVGVVTAGGNAGFGNRGQRMQVEQLDCRLASKQGCHSGGAALTAQGACPVLRGQSLSAANIGANIASGLLSGQQSREWLLMAATLTSQQPMMYVSQQQGNAEADMTTMMGGATSPMQEHLLEGWLPTRNILAPTGQGPSGNRGADLACC